MNRGVGQSKPYPRFHTKLLSQLVVFAIFALIANQVSRAQQRSVASVEDKLDLLVVQAAVFVPGSLPQRFPQGSRIVRIPAKPSDARPINLTGDFFAAADPEPSFDASKILFSAQKSRSDTWQVWEMNADGSGERQITHCVEDCLRAAYLPGNEMVLTASNRRGEQTFTNLAVIAADGSNLHSITFGRSNFELETVLRDGRVLASASWPLLAVPSATGSRGLYTLRPDGAGLDSLRCDHDSAATRGDAVELDDGTIVFVKTVSHEKEQLTELAKITPGALHETTVRIAASAYHFPAQLLYGTVLVSYTHSPVGEKTSAPSVYTFRRDTRKLGDRVYGDPTLACLQAVLLRAHAVPKKFWSILNLESNTGSFISLNSASSADELTGRIPEPISRVRVLGMNSETGLEKLLGEAPVENDGSFFVEVPANTPVRFELLGAQGQVLRAERGWVWARPGEQRGCAGCHSSKAVAPENRWPLTLKRFDTPTKLAAPENVAAQGKVN